MQIKLSDISTKYFERIHGKTSNENLKNGFSEPTIDETPEDLFDIYEKSRSVSDYQKLYNKGIRIHEIRGNEWVECNYFEPRPEQSFIKVYNIIDGKMTFTKIGVWSAKK